MKETRKFSDYHFESWTKNATYSQYCRLLVEVNGVHNNEDLLVLVSEAGVGLLEGSLAVVLDPAVFAQEGRGQAQWKTELERKTVNSRR